MQFVTISILNRLLTSRPKAIELIPGDGQEWLEVYPDNADAPFLFIDHNLGVPEKVLYRTYMEAVKILGEPSSCLRRLETEEGLKQRALALTSIILLANPAHQASLNIRKTIILVTKSCLELNEADFRKACKAELEFIAALLSVKQCAKVSMLWHHRRVILSALCSSSTLSGFLHKRTLSSPEVVVQVPPPTPNSFTDDHFVTSIRLPLSTLHVELEIATRACEIYPRNYYAWCHRALCLQSYVFGHNQKGRASALAASQPGEMLMDACESNVESGPPGETLTSDHEQILQTELDAAKLWLDRHVSDHSAADYICQVVEALYQLCSPIPAHFTRAEDKSDFNHDPKSVAATPSLRAVHTSAAECTRHALSLVRSYPSHETLWLYLRRSLQLTSTNDTLSMFTLAQDADLLARTILVEATKSCQASPYDCPAKGRDDEVHVGARQALRFLLWQTRNKRSSSSSENSTESGKKYDFLSLACSHFEAASSAMNDVAMLRAITLCEL